MEIIRVGPARGPVNRIYPSTHARAGATPRVIANGEKFRFWSMGESPPPARGWIGGLYTSPLGVNRSAAAGLVATVARGKTSAAGEHRS
jgi:hypothetical protein